jgi:hypothetical protein
MPSDVLFPCNIKQLLEWLNTQHPQTVPYYDRDVASIINQRCDHDTNVLAYNNQRGHSLIRCYFKSNKNHNNVSKTIFSMGYYEKGAPHRAIFDAPDANYEDLMVTHES